MVQFLAVTLAAVVTIGIAFLSLDGSLFGWHPALMTAAFLGFPVLSATTIRNRFSKPGSTKPTVQFHLLLNLCALMSGAAGAAAIWMNKDANGSPHLTSWHAWAGVGAGAMFALAGAGAFLKLITHGLVWKDNNHRMGARVAMMVGCVALVLGLYSGWGAFKLGPVLQAVAAAATIVAIAIALFSTPVVFKPTK